MSQIVITGLWNDGRTSRQRPADMHIDADGRCDVYDDNEGRLAGAADFSKLKVSDRIGNTPRYLTFPGGARFETRDNEAVDKLLPRRESLVHRLESHWHFVVLSVVLLVAFSAMTIKFGIPAAADALARHVPQTVLEIASEESRSILDSRFFSDSRLDAKTQERVKQHVMPYFADNPALSLKLRFRHGGKQLGANAFALPDGTMILTDELVSLSENDNQLLAIVAHEVGHVQYRHGIRSVIQSSILAFSVSLLFGDMAAATEMLMAMPVIMTTLSYSREFEREADRFAYRFLQQNDIEPRHFADIMQRLSDDAYCRKQFKQGVLPDTAQKKQDRSAWTAEERWQKCRKLISEKPKPEDDGGWSAYLSTHPSSDERIRMFANP